MQLGNCVIFGQLLDETTKNHKQKGRQRNALEILDVWQISLLTDRRSECSTEQQQSSTSTGLA
jgi:hypothetical protein